MRNMTKSEMASIIYRLESEIRTVRNENRKIERSINGILKCKDKLKRDVQDEHDAEVEEVRKEYDSLLEENYDHVTRERERMLNALGMDDIAWERVSYKY
jgi:hypothetical protein